MMSGTTVGTVGYRLPIIEGRVPSLAMAEL